MVELTKEHFDQQIGKLVSKTEIGEMFEEQAKLINRAFQEQKDHFDKRLDSLESRIARVENELKAVSAKLTAHLDLSDKRYLELKHKNLVVAKWVKKIADKTGVEIDLAELDKF